MSRGVRVVVASEDHALRRAMADALRAAAHSVAELASTTQFLSLLETWGPDVRADLADVMICDDAAPGGGLLASLGAVRATGWGRPVIVTTAWGDEGTRRDAAALGAIVLDKPFELSELLAVVDVVARRRRNP